MFCSHVPSEYISAVPKFSLLEATNLARKIILGTCFWGLEQCPAVVVVFNPWKYLLKQGYYPEDTSIQNYVQIFCIVTY